MPKPLIERVLTFDPAEMALRGRIGAYTTHSRHDPHALTANARAAFLASFEAQVDPDGTLPDAERRRRAEAARRAHYARMALKSAEARRAEGRRAVKANAQPWRAGRRERDMVPTTPSYHAAPVTPPLPADPILRCGWPACGCARQARCRDRCPACSWVMAHPREAVPR
jgi:hypothetical protein